MRPASRLGTSDSTTNIRNMNSSYNGSYGESRPGSPNGMSASSKRTITKEEMQKNSLRLARPKDHIQELEPLHKPKLIAKDQLNSSIDRMYKQAMDQRSRSITNARQRRDESEAPKMMKISAEDLDESVKRMYNMTVDKRQKTQEALSNKYLYRLPPIHDSLEQVRLNSSKGGKRPGSRAQSPSRPSSPDATHNSTVMSAGGSPSRSELVQRLYTSAIDNHAKDQDKMYQRYVAATEPKMMKADKDEIGAIVARLYAGTKA